MKIYTLTLSENIKTPQVKLELENTTQKVCKQSKVNNNITRRVCKQSKKPHKSKKKLNVQVKNLLRLIK